MKVRLGDVLRECKRRGIRFADDNAEAVKILIDINKVIEKLVFKIDSKVVSNSVRKANANEELVKLEKTLEEAGRLSNRLWQKLK